MERALDALDRLLDRDPESLSDSQAASEADALRLVAGDFARLTSQIGRTAGTEITPAGEALAAWGYAGRGGGLQAQHLLSFHASDIPIDGAFHPIRVVLKDAPRGAKVLHRPGYFVPKPVEEEEEELASTLRTAELILSGNEGGELETSALVASF